MAGEEMDQGEVDALARKLRDAAKGIRANSGEKLVPHHSHLDQTEPDWCDARIRAVSLELAVKYATSSTGFTQTGIINAAIDFCEFIMGDD